MQPTLVSLLRKSHGLRSLVGYSPWSCKESVTSEVIFVNVYNNLLFTDEESELGTEQLERSFKA